MTLCTGCSRMESSDVIKENTLNVTTFNTWKSDSTLLYTDESAVLIDTGESDDGDDILKAIYALGINHLDALILTHFDKDHTGGASVILKKISVDHVYVSCYPKESDEYTALLQALEDIDMEAEVLRETITFTPDDLLDLPVRSQHYNISLRRIGNVTAVSDGNTITISQ